MESKEELMDQLIERAERAGEAGEEEPESKETPVEFSEVPDGAASEEPAPEKSGPEAPEVPEAPEAPEAPEKDAPVSEGDGPKELKEPGPGDLPTERRRIKREEDTHRELKNAIHNEIHAEVVKGYQNTESTIRESNAALTKSVEETVRETAAASEQKMEEYAAESGRKIEEFAASTKQQIEEGASWTREKIGNLEERQKSSEEFQKGNRQWLFLLLILLILNFAISAALLFRIF